MKRNTLIIFLFTACQWIGINSIKAQGSDEVRMLTGIVLCSEDSVMYLENVTIYNKRNGSGTTTDKNGHFEIDMIQTDTIVFSTVQHREQYFFLDHASSFPEQGIEIQMRQDTVYLEVVSIIGFNKYQQFKEELLQLDLSDEDVDMHLPLINKYARQYATEVQAYELKGPLTYLGKKIRKISRRKRYKYKYKNE